MKGNPLSFKLARPGGTRLLVCSLLLVASMGTLLSVAATPASNKQRVEALVATLNSNGGQKEKADACRELARIGTREAVAPLAALLGDENLSHMARYGLETIPGAAVDKVFRDALGKLKGRPLVGVIGSIGVRKDAKAVKPLTKLLRDPDTDVAQAAARALGSIGNAAAAKALQGVLRGAPQANQSALCEGLFRCAEALERNGKRPQATAIYDQVRSMEGPHQVRTAALRGAILARGEKGWALLLESARSEDFAVFQAAMRISAEIPDTELTRVLAVELAGLPADHQVLLAQTLARRGDVAAVPALSAAANNGPKPVRLAAVRALAEIGSPSAVPVLVALVADSDAGISQGAKESLASLRGKEADDAVINMLSSGDVNRRMTGMELAVRRRMTNAVPALTAAARDLDVNIRMFAVRRLGELAGPDQFPTLLQLLEAANTPEDVEATEQALTMVSLRIPRADASAAELAGCLPRVGSAKQCSLLRVLTAVGGTKALETVQAAVDSTDPEVRTTAVRSLGAWNSADAAPVLLALLKKGTAPSDASLLLRGYLRLAALPELPADQRLAMCREAAGLVQHLDEKRLLLGALGEVESPESLASLAPYLDDSETKEEAATAAVNISEKLLKGDNGGKWAAKLAEYLEKATRVTEKESLKKRAQSLLELAQSKRAGK